MGDPGAEERKMAPPPASLLPGASQWTLNGCRLTRVPTRLMLQDSRGAFSHTTSSALKTAVCAGT